MFLELLLYSHLHLKSKYIFHNNPKQFQRIMPTLPERPKLIVNRLVDIIAYLRFSTVDDEKKRFIYTRGNVFHNNPKQYQLYQL